jgi:nicotinate-nucleotide pyrophosphorylase (carboxylating)
MEAQVEQLIMMALEEDLGSGDITGRFFAPENHHASAAIVAREPGVLSGVDVAAAVFHKVDPSLEIETSLAEGSPFSAADTLLSVHGDARSILAAERTALNFLQRLCGIASVTRAYVQAAQPYDPQILDTRKTTPGWRWLEKAAVRAGGGVNHRMGLYDQVLVKDNHLLTRDHLGELQQAIHAARAARPDVCIELEADTLEQVADFLSLDGVDILLLDNMPCDDMRRCVILADGKVQLEASGTITLARIAAVAATGVDRISCGALTHSVRALDLGLDFLSP